MKKMEKKTIQTQRAENTYLLGEHGPNAGEHRTEAFLLDKLRERRHQSLIGIFRISNLAYARAFHWAEKDTGDRTGKDRGSNVGSTLASLDQLRHNRLENLIDAKLHGSLDAISNHSRSEAAKEHGRSIVLDDGESGRQHALVVHLRHRVGTRSVARGLVRKGNGKGIDHRASEERVAPIDQPDSTGTLRSHTYFWLGLDLGLHDINRACDAM